MRYNKSKELTKDQNQVEYRESGGYFNSSQPPQPRDRAEKASRKAWAAVDDHRNSRGNRLNHTLVWAPVLTLGEKLARIEELRQKAELARLMISLVGLQGVLAWRWLTRRKPARGRFGWWEPWLRKRQREF